MQLNTDSATQELKKFDSAERDTWRQLFARQAPLRGIQMVPEFDEGLQYLGMTGNQIPLLQEMNSRLKEKTQFQGVPVTGHEDPRSFFPMLAERKFPIGNFIRDAKDLNYTPAPDVFHDAYGHLPFFVNTDYAHFCAEFGRLAAQYIDQPEKLRQWERLFWFTIEFALLETSANAQPASHRKIFGAGIASSFGECAYALSPEPEVLDFDLETVRNQEFRIDEMQKRLFILKSRGQLYECLPEFDRRVRKS